MNISPIDIEVDYKSNIIKAHIYEIDEVLVTSNPKNLSGTFYRLFYTDSQLEDYFLMEFVKLNSGEFAELSRDESLVEPFEQILKKAALLA